MKPPKTISPAFWHRIEIHNSLAGSICRILLYTGLRCSEVSIFFKRYFEIRKYMKNIVMIEGKGKKERYVFIPNIIVKDLDYVLQHYPKILNCSRWKIFRLVKELGNNIDFPKLHPHMFRHTYATQLLKKHTPLKYIQVLLGHSDIRTTGNIYLHPDTQTLLECVEALSFSPTTQSKVS